MIFESQTEKPIWKTLFSEILKIHCMSLTGRLKHYIDFISFIYITLFAYTAINKFWDLDYIQTSLEKYPIIGPAAPFFTWAVPIAEVIVVTLLFVPKTRFWGIVSSTVLLISFTIYIIYLMAVSSVLPCTCGGMISTLTWGQHLFVNALLSVSGVIGILLIRKRQLPTIHKPALKYDTH